MKSLTLIVLVILFTAFVGEKHKSDLEKSNLKGKVKMITMLKYTKYFQTNRLDRDTLPLIEIQKYDSMGNLQEDILADSNGSDAFFLNGKWLYLYSNSILINVRIFDYKDSLLYNDSCYNDKDGKLVYTAEYSNGKIVNKDSSFYAPNGNLTKLLEYRNVYNGPNYIIRTTKYYYDKKNNLEYEERKTNHTMNSFSYFDGSIIYEYYSNKQSKEEIHYARNGTCTSHEHLKYIKYDDNKNWTEVVGNDKVSGDSMIIKRKIEYYQ